MANANRPLRNVRLLASFLILLVLFCLSVPVGAAEKLTIFSYWTQDAHKEAMRQVVAGFRAANPDLQVEFVEGQSGQAGRDQVIAMIIGGTAPDVAFLDRYYTGDWALNGYIQPIEKLLPNAAGLFIEGPIQEATLAGHLYGVPISFDIRGLYWNVTHFEAAGLPAQDGPKTWEQLNDFARKLDVRNADGALTRAGLLPWNGNWYHHAWFWHFGGDYFDPVRMLPTINRPENIRAFEWIAEVAGRTGNLNTLRAEGLTDSHSAVFANGKVSMVLSTQDMGETFRRTNNAIEFWGGATPYPEGGRNGSWAGGVAFTLPLGAKNVEGAARFFQYLAKAETQVQFASISRLLPPQKEALQRVLSMISPLERVFVSQAPTIRWRHPFTNLVYSALTTAQNDVINAKKSPQGALDELQRTMLAQHDAVWKKLQEMSGRK